MEPRSVGFSDIAKWDPIAALGIAKGIPRVPIQMNCAASFSSFSTLQVPIEGDLDTTISQRTWISRIDYSLSQPNVFAGNIFKTLSDAMLKIGQPGIAVRVSVHGGPRYQPVPNFTPIENFTNTVLDNWPSGWPLFRNQSIKVEFQLTQSPPSTSPNAPPYNVVVTFTGWQFLNPILDEMDPNVARTELIAMGLYPAPPK